MRALVLALVLAAAACSAGPRTRQFPISKAGATEAIALLLKQPANSYGWLQLNVPVEVIGEPSEVWQGLPSDAKSVGRFGEAGCEASCQRLGSIEGVLAFDRDDATASGVTPVRTFPATMEGVAEAIAWRDQKPRDVRMISIGQPPPRTGQGHAPYKWEWTWRDVRGDMKEVTATENHLCVYANCFAHADVRALMLEAGTIGQPDSFVRQQYPISRETLPGLLRELGARPEPSKSVTLETRVILRADRRIVDVYEVSVLEDDRLCGLAAEPPTFREERCYPFAQIQQIAMRDHNRSAGEVLGDALMTPFRVVGAVGQSMAIGAH